jgi:hypothetical protein
MSETRQKKRRFWEAKHIRILKDGARRKLPASKIARDLRRSQGAVRQKAFELNLSLDTRRAA